MAINTRPELVYQLKITLDGSKPPIWRRFQVDSQIKLAKLHRVIQVVMGWEDGHLHQFIVKKEIYGVPYEDDFNFGGPEIHNEKKYQLNELVSAPKSKIEYEYDFGDGWGHTILLEKILEPDDNVSYPICTEGKRACPPEDCGGIWGYEDMLETLQSEGEDKEELLEWLGMDFDPEAFDIEQVNWKLKKIK